MSLNPTVTPITKQNPFEAARLTLISALLSLKAPAAYPSFPSPTDHEGLAAHIREAAQIFDGWLAAVGSEVRDHAVTSIDVRMFSGSFEAAIEGNETYEIEAQAEALKEYASERRTSMRRMA
jgi:lipase chaperone LimK